MKRFAVLLVLLASCATTKQPVLDLKITNGRIFDGTGAPWYRGDIGVRGETIVAIGDLSATSARTTLDAREQVISPGFSVNRNRRCSPIPTWRRRCGKA